LLAAVVGCTKSCANWIDDVKPSGKAPVNLRKHVEQHQDQQGNRHDPQGNYTDLGPAIIPDSLGQGSRAGTTSAFAPVAFVDIK
jgi:hypothetical protein